MFVQYLSDLISKSAVYNLYTLRFSFVDCVKKTLFSSGVKTNVPSLSFESIAKANNNGKVKFPVLSTFTQYKLLFDVLVSSLIVDS